MKAYLEYLELYDYFGRGGIPRLGQAQFLACSEELRALAERSEELSQVERTRMAELKDLLFRDKP